MPLKTSHFFPCAFVVKERKEDDIMSEILIVFTKLTVDEGIKFQWPQHLFKHISYCACIEYVSILLTYLAFRTKIGPTEHALEGAHGICPSFTASFILASFILCGGLA
jgi:hypothetical protein